MQLRGLQHATCAWPFRCWEYILLSPAQSCRVCASALRLSQPSFNGGFCLPALLQSHSALLPGQHPDVFFAPRLLSKPLKNQPFLSLLLQSWRNLTAAMGSCFLYSLTVTLMMWRGWLWGGEASHHACAGAWERILTFGLHRATASSVCYTENSHLKRVRVPVHTPLFFSFSQLICSARLTAQDLTLTALSKITVRQYTYSYISQDKGHSVERCL